MSENTFQDFSIGDKVKRVLVDGPVGVVKNIRTETIRTTLKSDEKEPPSVCITVVWDNGTLSHFVPDGLEKVTR